MVERVAVNMQLTAREAGAGNLKNGTAGAQLVADAEISDVDAAGGEVFPEGSVEQWISAGGEMVDYFGGDDEDGFLGTAMDFGVRVQISFEAESRDITGGDSPLRQAAGRNVDLDDGALHGESIFHRRDAETRREPKKDCLASLRLSVSG